MEYFRALDAEKESLTTQLIDLRENVENRTQRKVSGRTAYEALLTKRDALKSKIDNIGAYGCILEFLVKIGTVEEKKYLVDVSEELARTKLEGEGYTIIWVEVH